MKNLSSASAVKQIIMTRITDNWSVGGQEGSYMYAERGPRETHANTLSIITLQNIVTDVRDERRKQSRIVLMYLVVHFSNSKQTKCIHRFILYVRLFVVGFFCQSALLLFLWVFGRFLYIVERRGPLENIQLYADVTKHYRWRTANFRPLLNAYGLQAGKNILSCYKCCKMDLRTALIGCLYNEQGVLREPTLTRIPTGIVFSISIFHSFAF